jgi:hypothetical protein
MLPEIGKNLPSLVSKVVALRKQEVNRIQQKIQMLKKMREISACSSSDDEDTVINDDVGKELAEKRKNRFDNSLYNCDELAYLEDRKNKDSDNDTEQDDEDFDDVRVLKKSKVDDMDELSYLKDLLQKKQQSNPDFIKALFDIAN